MNFNCHMCGIMNVVPFRKKDCQVKCFECNAVNSLVVTEIPGFGCGYMFRIKEKK